MSLAYEGTLFERQRFVFGLGETVCGYNDDGVLLANIELARRSSYFSLHLVLRALDDSVGIRDTHRTPDGDEQQDRKER